MLSPQRQEQLSELAEYVADFYCLDAIVDPRIIADNIGITHSLSDYGSVFDGLLEHQSGCFHIYLNSKGQYNLSNTRVRFSFAHELGHYYIDEHREALRAGRTPVHPSKNDFSSVNIVEQEADFFASSLLLPKSRVLKGCFRKKFTPELVTGIANSFKTSLTATLIKFASIGNHPIMVVCARNNLISWRTYSHDFPYRRIKSYRGQPPTDSLAGRFFQTGKAESDRDTLVADDWFDNLADYKLENSIYEWCIYAPKSQFTLSVIWED